jgi:pimeloyl-ACP methyl ester carboxylesterase
MPPYSLHGRGSVRAIALHGWFGDRTAFDPLLPAIDPDRLSLASFDYRGYGAARPSQGPFDILTVAADALALADGLGWEHFSLIGHSMGGKAALRIAVAAPDRVDRIAAITPVWAGTAPFDAETLAFFRSAADSLDARQGIIDNTTGGRLPTIWTRGMAEHSHAISDREAFAAYLESWALDDFAEVTSGLKTEVMAIAGAQDRGIPVEGIRATWLARLANATLTVLPEAGHYPAEECPLILARILTAFLDPTGER